MTEPVGREDPKPALRVRVAEGPAAIANNVGLGAIVAIFLGYLGDWVARRSSAAFGLHLASSTTIAAGVVAFAVALVFMLRRSVFAYVEVGDDGVVVRGALGKRFLPYSELTGVAIERAKSNRMLRFHMTDETRVTVAVEGMSQDGRRALLDRVQSEIAAFHASSDEAAAALDRGDRTAARWRKDLATLWKADYRRAPLSREQVERTLADGATPPARRIGAAIALIASGFPGSDERVLREAAECVNPKLRAALEAIARGNIDDDVLAPIAPPTTTASTGVRVAVQPVDDAVAAEEEAIAAEPEAVSRERSI